ncbi:Uncharacterized conserved protein [Cedecea neteri]|uniref:Uncharacterized conserved protein n=1 Tax=Cedecea neteri TaxID=158822 RepID=A0A2X3J4V5_9ENTR|nr:Uncharacterized conserved protein [Cedecea neteri]
MEILITGGSGLIGRHLTARLLELGHTVSVVTRSPEKARKRLDNRVALLKGLDGLQNLDAFDAVINLAGEPIADKRWRRSKSSACARVAGKSPSGWSNCLRPASSLPKRLFPAQPPATMATLAKWSSPKMNRPTTNLPTSFVPAGSKLPAARKAKRREFACYAPALF